MVAPFNACKVDISCVGNHDLDFGIIQMRKCIAKMTTNEHRPMGMSNEDIEYMNMSKSPLKRRLSRSGEQPSQESATQLVRKISTVPVENEDEYILGVDIDPHPT